MKNSNQVIRSEAAAPNAVCGKDLQNTLEEEAGGFQGHLAFYF